MIRSFKSKALRSFWERGATSGLRPDWIAKVERMLDQLDAAAQPNDMNIPGSKFHALKGNLSGRYAVTISRNWRITFKWEDGDAIDVDLEDYHGQ